MKALILKILVFYKKFISPWLPRSCRFSPTCSEYAQLAIMKHGIVKGLWMTAHRLFRCQPFCSGGIDIP